MIPPPHHPVWARLIRGELTHTFAAAAAGMLIMRLQRQHRKQPESLSSLIDEMRLFFTKYEATCAADIARLLGKN